MWMYGPGVKAATSRTTSSTNAYVSSFRMQSEVKPTSMPEYGALAMPSQFSFAYEDSAALTCPGMSISGTTSTNRSRA